MRNKFLPFLLLFPIIVAACNLPGTSSPLDLSGNGGFEDGAATPPPAYFAPPTTPPDALLIEPTPDPAHALPDLRSQAQSYVVQVNDTLGRIAQQYGVTLEALMEANGLSNPDLLSVGQLLEIPAPQPAAPGPPFKLIPDSELVYGPYNMYFDLDGFIREKDGYLAAYREEVDGQVLSGAEVIARVARDYSVNPRLLLAVLEYQSGWLTEKKLDVATATYPMGITDSWHSGLYHQLAWAADNLNLGFYLWRTGGLAAVRTTDGANIPLNDTLNAGTVGVQYLFALLNNEGDWRSAVGVGGFIHTYIQLYGDPFRWAVEPPLPAGLTQPELQLPFEPGVPWVFTGGPHGGWGDGSAWAALDFAPGYQELGCVQSNAWVVAMADGLIIRSDNGAVLQDLDGDGNPGTGWVLFYMHIENRERVGEGVALKAGERIGHPSCEGGFSTGTHVHVARMYNGEWIPADGDLPFVMDGWVTLPTGVYYDGLLERDGKLIEACECQEPEHMVQR